MKAQYSGAPTLPKVERTKISVEKEKQIDVAFHPKPPSDRDRAKAIAKIRCGFCSMPGTVFCDWQGCSEAMCKRHTTHTDAGDFCPHHRPGYRAG